MWQFLISSLYLSFTVILTSQLVSREWAQYAITPKGLRVSKRREESRQRSTFFISMPLRFGLLIMAVFAVEHWLLSQSTFVIRVLMFDWDGTPLPGRTTSGFSVIPSFLGKCIVHRPRSIYLEYTGALSFLLDSPADNPEIIWQHSFWLC